MNEPQGEGVTAVHATLTAAPAVRDSGRSGWRFPAAAQLLLLGAVLVGLLGMHVLTAEDTAGGHGMLPAVTGHDGHGASMTGGHQMVADPVPTPMDTNTTTPAVSNSSDGTGHDGLASCVLFLALGGAAVLLALLSHRGGGAASGASGPVTVAAAWLRRRGPPPAWPRVALCVIRI